MFCPTHFKQVNYAEWISNLQNSLTNYGPQKNHSDMAHEIWRGVCLKEFSTAIWHMNFKPTKLHSDKFVSHGIFGSWCFYTVRGIDHCNAGLLFLFWAPCDLRYGTWAKEAGIHDDHWSRQHWKSRALKFRNLSPLSSVSVFYRGAFVHYISTGSACSKWRFVTVNLVGGDKVPTISFD